MIDAVAHLDRNWFGSVVYTAEYPDSFTLVINPCFFGAKLKKYELVEIDQLWQRPLAVKNEQIFDIRDDFSVLRRQQRHKNLVSLYILDWVMYLDAGRQHKQHNE